MQGEQGAYAPRAPLSKRFLAGLVGPPFFVGTRATAGAVRTATRPARSTSARSAPTGTALAHLLELLLLLVGQDLGELAIDILLQLVELLLLLVRQFQLVLQECRQDHAGLRRAKPTS